MHSHSGALYRHSADYCIIKHCHLKAMKKMLCIILKENKMKHLCYEIKKKLLCSIIYLYSSSITFLEPYILLLFEIILQLTDIITVSNWPLHKKKSHMNRNRPVRSNNDKRERCLSSASFTIKHNRIFCKTLKMVSCGMVWYGMDNGNFLWHFELISGVAQEY